MTPPEPPPPPAPTTVEDVLARLQALGEELPPHDGVAVFNRVYLAATSETAHRLAAGHFEDAAFTSEWSARFAALYLTAVTGGRPTACWRPLLRSRHDGRVHPLQSALAGINAHISHDLPLALTATCRARQTVPDRVRADFDRLNAVLAGIERRVREDLLPGPDPLEAADPLTHLVSAWSLEQARDAAWSTAAVLWRLRRHPAAAAQLTHRLSRQTGLVSRLLLTPLRGGA